MKAETLDLLRCPYCGGRFELVEALHHDVIDGDDLMEGVLGCHCCLFPVVAGIPVLHLQPEAVAAREALEARRPDRAFRALVSHSDEARAARFEEAARSATATYREVIDTLGSEIEGGYFLYRFSDPSYLVASAVVGAVAGTVLRKRGRAVDLCGGSGHLTRLLLGLSSPAPVTADLSFPKLWLASRFVAPGCEPVCCDGNAPLPFACGAFAFSMCADAFMFVWTKRQFVSEMLRLTDRDGPRAVVVTHAHNQRVWSPSHGDPLPPEGYRELFETQEPRLFSESGLLTDVVAGGPLDLSRRDDPETLEADPALIIVASNDDAVFRRHPLAAEPPARGELRLNPLYAAESAGTNTRLRLHFPSPDYEEEFGACRDYLPEELTVDAAALANVAEGRRTTEVLELLRRRVVLDVPARYY